MKPGRVQSAIRDPLLRKFTTLILREYRKSGTAAQNENLKHVRRMVHIVRGKKEELLACGCDPEILEVSLLLSDIGKEQHFIQKYLPFYKDSPFKAFLDHSRISLKEGNRLRKLVGIPDRVWRQILGAIIGHDGPSISGSWWKTNYEREIGRRYASLHTVNSLIHCYLDRMDQGGIFRGRGDQLNGGLRKISYDLFAKGPLKGNLPAVIQEVFGPTRVGTFDQLDHLDQITKPELMGSKPLPPFLREVRKRFEEAEKYFEHVILDDALQGAVRIVLDGGTSVEVRDLDAFWRTLSKVTPKSPLAAVCRIS